MARNESSYPRFNPSDDLFHRMKTNGIPLGISDERDETIADGELVFHDFSPTCWNSAGFCSAVITSEIDNCASAIRRTSCIFTNAAEAPAASICEGKDHISEMSVTRVSITLSSRLFLVPPLR